MKIILRIRKEGERYFAYGWKNYELRMSGFNLEYYKSCNDPEQRWLIEGFESGGILFVDKLKKDHKVNKKYVMRKPVEVE